MKLVLFLIAFCFVALSANSQQKIDFHLSQTGDFLTGDGEDYVVIPFEGKTAHDIFMEIVQNINSLYKSPKEVLSTIEDQSISIFAMGSPIAYDKIIGLTREGYGYYTIKILVKDNKIRFELPKIDKVSFGSGNQKITVSYSYQIGGYFDKKGVVKSKREAWVKAIESKMKGICNYIIMGEQKKKVDDNW